MGQVQSSGAVSIGDLQTQLGGSSPASMSEYYRGGSYVPATRTTTVTEGPYWRPHSYTSGRYEWDTYGGSYPNGTYLQIWWANVNIVFVTNGPGYTSYTTGGYTYYRGTYRGVISAGYDSWWSWEVYRTYTTTTSINTSVPSSGTISMNQFYGAANP